MKNWLNKAKTVIYAAFGKVFTLYDILSSFIQTTRYFLGLFILVLAAVNAKDIELTLNIDNINMIALLYNGLLVGFYFVVKDIYEYRIVRQITSLLALPVYLVFYAITHFMGVFIYMISPFTIIFIVPYNGLKYLDNAFAFSEDMYNALSYLFLVIGLVVFSYFGKQMVELMGLFSEGYKKYLPERVRNAAFRISDTFKTRMIAYSVMIFVYVIFNMKLLPESWDFFNFFSGLKEALVTFVAIDAAYQLYTSHNKKKGSEHTETNKYPA